MTCICCESDKSKAIFKWKDEDKNLIQMKRCLGCGLLFQEPMQSDEELSKLYNEEFFSAYEKHFIDFRKRQFQRDINKINALKAPPGNILDVGCAFGLFLVAARSRGWNVFGVDVSKNAVDHAKKEYELKVFLGTLEQAKFNDGLFDVVTAWDVIEHVTDPDAFLSEVNRVLKQNGIFALRTPNADSLFLKIVKMVNMTVGDYFAKVGPRFVHHKYLFTLPSLKALLWKKGFKIVSTHMEMENLIIVDKPSAVNHLKAASKRLIKSVEFFHKKRRASIVIYARKV